GSDQLRPRGSVPLTHPQPLEPSRQHHGSDERCQERSRSMTTYTYTPTAPRAGRDLDSNVGRRPRRNLARIIAIETKFEFLKLLRVPVYSISVLAFPLMFYLVFGSFYGQFDAQGVMVSKYMVATFGAGGVLSAALFAFGVGVASERGQGWLRLKRVSPMPPMAYFASK